MQENRRKVPRPSLSELQLSVRGVPRLDVPRLEVAIYLALLNPACWVRPSCVYLV